MATYEHRKKIGIFGEDLALEYLVKKGYKIVDKNVRTGHQEIDIIAKDKKNMLVFVEVKTRTSIYGEAEESVFNRKLAKLKLGMMKYLTTHKIRSPFFRLDLVSIYINRQTKIAKIKHYKNIF
jgi:putative endonuclease